MTRLVVAAEAMVLVVLSVAAALTRPFTGPADAVVALGFVVVLVQGPARRLLGLGPAGPATGGVDTGRPGDGRRWGARWALWVVPAVSIVAWELFCFLSAPRSDHPTLSSMLDAVTAHQTGRGLLFFGWLALGWYLVTR